MLKKIDTFHFGPFYFSDQYDDGKLRDLIQSAQTVWTIVKDIPILPNLSSQIEDELIKRSIFGTAAIEGNPLSEEEVGRVISEEQKKKALKKFEVEIRNLKTAYDELVSGIKGIKGPLTLSEELIKDVNRKIMTGCEDNNDWVAGNYRNFDVKVGDDQHGGIYIPPKELDDIRILMRSFIEWINSVDVIQLNPTIRAALAHYYLGRIHPFGDGNGRTARLLEAMILRASGFKYVSVMLANFYYKNIDEYFWAFSLAGREGGKDITVFLEFVFKGHTESLEAIKRKIFFLIKKFTLRDYYLYLRDRGDISERSYKLLMVLGEVPEKFSLKDLYDKAVLKPIYSEISDRTARRDLEKMAVLNLLVLQDGLYELNWRVLERE